ncbi:uncharacterized protein LOC130769860 [Actinidia eriantha]|uniref:uncharacterized protein LOC130769860 n=1 Tax=Actinidia eriantha TaxID=165200 RepID=UPI0025875AE0|nr:uncharacterized protein LOC130769860 [Actinidia eriantha]
MLFIQGSSIKETVKFQQKKTAQPDKKARATNSNNMNLKVLVSKSKKTILYGEAGVDMVDFLFSFLTFPLRSVIKLLGKNSGALFQIKEASYPQYVFDFDKSIWLIDDKKAEPRRSTSEERHRLGVIIDPKSPTGEVQAAKGYVKGPATFMIKDNLFVSPSPITGMALLNQLNVPINDVVERVVTIGIGEALNLLNASLISKTE